MPGLNTDTFEAPEVVKQPVNFNGDIIFKGKPFVQEFVTVTESIDVAGTIHVKGMAKFQKSVKAKSIVVTGTLVVSAGVEINCKAVIVNGALHGGPFTIDGDFELHGGMLLDGDLTVTGQTRFGKHKGYPGNVICDDIVKI